MSENGWGNNGESGGMKFKIGENGRFTTKICPRLVFHELHMEWPRRELGTWAMEGERSNYSAAEQAVRKYIYIRVK